MYAAATTTTAETKRTSGRWGGWPTRWQGWSKRQLVWLVDSRRTPLTLSEDDDDDDDDD
eukprot:CAMPEP_0194774800 /NCGR_PEP_ID=MMETSP0323_2-20130528/58577_1 /TAXON_ID=2866 ORGANISM="Crypthecodinium cohnii, Strain Seligo" /NCGR_SAMPLE_ID=MMETSP0323_2 /ASSEMBLY_ACC=CAM_ASM_000346 /LENGTH=58 /DNA_ID=CAMNT_0039710487 /DNA_START=88 /DNA_END=261 /DNA_ORIENTATION=-